MIHFWNRFQCFFFFIKHYAWQRSGATSNLLSRRRGQRWFWKLEKETTGLRAENVKLSSKKLSWKIMCEIFANLILLKTDFSKKKQKKSFLSLYFSWFWFLTFQFSLLHQQMYDNLWSKTRFTPQIFIKLRFIFQRQF